MRKIDVAFLPAETEKRDLAQTTCVVLDIFRATTSMVTALINGCPLIRPVQSVEEAWTVARGIPAALLAGERQSVRIEGFDLGNSPREFTRERVDNRPVVMTTTNGTRAVRAVAGAGELLIGSFLNALAVCDTIQKTGRDLLILCAGTENQFSLEDSLCAGLLVHRLWETDNSAVELTDAAQGARLLYLQAQGNLLQAAATSKNGRRLYELDLAADVEYCLRLDTVSIVPTFAADCIRLSAT
ncbi:MAG TPA: 2-phosphosulfolactate phosphatase [Patescibacteria group bacterium]|nr:2-phosphosulfolactate phosphatase [Patescibacteria group bacterium]